MKELSFIDGFSFPIVWLLADDQFLALKMQKNNCPSYASPVISSVPGNRFRDHAASIYLTA